MSGCVSIVNLMPYFWGGLLLMALAPFLLLMAVLFLWLGFRRRWAWLTASVAVLFALPELLVLTCPVGPLRYTRDILAGNAAYMGDVVACMVLRAAGNAQPFGRAWLELAVRGAPDHPVLVAALIDAGERVDDPPCLVAQAVSSGNLESARLLLEHGAQPAHDDYGIGALNLAAITDSPEMVQLLLEYDAPLDATDTENRNPLQIAVANDNSRIAELQLAHGADPNGWFGGRTPLSVAASEKHPRQIQLLLRHGADPMRPDSCGDLPAYNALQSPPGRAAELLIPGISALAAAPLTASLKSATHPLLLHAAGILNATRPMQRLVNAGWPVDRLDPAGRTPLQVAVVHEASMQTLRYFFFLGADSNHQDRDGNTALHLLRERRGEDTLPVANLLLRRGASPDIPNASGETIANWLRQLAPPPAGAP